MEWIESLRYTINYIEKHLLDEITMNDIASNVYMSPFYIQKGFKFMTGYTITEYIKNRRLYMAALEIIACNSKVIDLALKYGYDTPESFTKAFKRFHGVSPMGVHKKRNEIQIFLPLKITINMKGGNEMDVRYEKMEKFKVIGFERNFRYEDCFYEIPKFWGEIFTAHIEPFLKKEKPESEIDEMVWNHKIGEFGLCYDEKGDKNQFPYVIGGRFQGGEVKGGLSCYEIPACEWAKFRCIGPMPGALQTVNTKIFNEWLPGNPEYEIAYGINIEWYSGKGTTEDPDYESEVWIPIKKKVK